jgi:hypothetical protein
MDAGWGGSIWSSSNSSSSNSACCDMMDPGLRRWSELDTAPYGAGGRGNKLLHATREAGRDERHIPLLFKILKHHSLQADVSTIERRPHQFSSRCGCTLLLQIYIYPLKTKLRTRA